MSLYCDDKGIAKGLEVNVRATGLVTECGYGGQQIRGDAFLSRIFDDDDAWYRKNFTLADMSSGASWVLATKAARASGGGNVSNLQSLTNQLAPAAVNVGPDGIGNAPDQQESAKYKWQQVDDEVEINAEMPEGTVKQDVKVVIKPKHLAVMLKGEEYFAGNLDGPVEHDGCTWTFAAGAVPLLTITLMKRDELRWSRCLC